MAWKTREKNIRENYEHAEYIPGGEPVLFLISSAAVIVILLKLFWSFLEKTSTPMFVFIWCTINHDCCCCCCCCCWWWFIILYFPPLVFINFWYSNINIIIFTVFWGIVLWVTLGIVELYCLQYHLSSRLYHVQIQIEFVRIFASFHCWF